MTAYKITCACGKRFTAKRANAKHCSDRCRQAAHRKPGNLIGLPARPPLRSEVSMVAATRARLTEVGRLDTELGAVAMLLATRLDAVDLALADAGISALVKEYRATMAEAVKDAEHHSQDPIEQIRQSAALKLIRGTG